MEQKDRILEGAEELFFKAGIRSVTMDDIAKHMGMSKKTIYQSYRDKDEIVNALVSKRLKEDQCQMQDIVENAANVIEELVNMMKCSEEFFSRINPILIHDLQKYYAEAWKLFQNFKSDVLMGFLEGVLQRGVAQGYVRPNMDTKILARMRVWQVEAGFDTTLFPQSEFNTWQVQQQLLEHFAYGICTPAGRKILDKYKNIIEQE
jgi:AcrR family transcriptional regulator